MNELDAEFKRLQKMRVELQEDLERENRAEYHRLTSVAAVAAVVSASLQYVGTVTFPHAHWDGVMTTATFVSVLVGLVWLFCVRARKTPRGIAGYLKVEKTLLINEMPNIFQILSLLGFLTVLLKQQWVKITVAIVITFLLLVYLTSRRRQMIYEAAGPDKKTEDEVTVPLSLVLGYVIVWSVYGLASLISVQIHT